jgi:hypothetical protein
MRIINRSLGNEALATAALTVGVRTFMFAFLAALIGTVGSTTGARATVIDFEDQPAGPSGFAATSGAQTLSYTLGGGLTATFTGGVILTSETGQTTDNSNIYATCNFCGGGTFANPLVVTFSQAIQNFQIDILNAISGDYEVSDNAGHTDFFNLPTTGGSLQTVGFAATGTIVQIAYLNDANSSFGAGNWDFAIDNVIFNQNTVGGNNSATPLPAALPLFATGLGALGLLARRRKRKAAALAAA